MKARYGSLLASLVLLSSSAFGATCMDSTRAFALKAIRAAGCDRVFGYEDAQFSNFVAPMRRGLGASAAESLASQWTGSEVAAALAAFLSLRDCACVSVDSSKLRPIPDQSTGAGWWDEPSGFGVAGLGAHPADADSGGKPAVALAASSGVPGKEGAFNLVSDAVAVVPEPGTLFLTISGILALVLWRLRVYLRT